MPHDTVIRPVQPGDLDALINLIADHAAYERATVDRENLRSALPKHIFGDAAWTLILVADRAGDLIGYLSAAREFSTWNAADYLYMDCLYLAPTCRGDGIGGMLMKAAARYAADHDLGWMEWQTPDWNTGAIRFYERLGAVAKSKFRFSVAVKDLSAGEPEPACLDIA
ncbi:MAG: GCN5 family acetyltransferase [Thalassospira sp. Nap_22]|nr:MAG: GCN5 family acetyltransferase [Thalassospira sp. Nap_22]